MIWIYFSKKIYQKEESGIKLEGNGKKGMKKRLCLLLYIDSYGINQLIKNINGYYLYAKPYPGNTCWLRIKRYKRLTKSLVSFTRSWKKVDHEPIG